MSNKAATFHDAATEVQKYIDNTIEGWVRRIESEYKEVGRLLDRYKLAGDARVGLNMEENIPRLVRKEISLVALQQTPRYSAESLSNGDLEGKAKSWMKDVVSSLRKHLADVIDANSGRSASTIEAPLFFEKITALNEQIDDIRHHIRMKVSHLDFESEEFA